MRSINRISGVMLASLGVLLGVMLAVSPGGALAESVTEVFFVNLTPFVLDTEGPFTFQFTLFPGEPPSPDRTFQLLETNPLTGDILHDATGAPIVSDTVLVSSFLLQAEAPVPCEFSVCPPIFAPLFAQTFTVSSDSNTGGLHFVPGADLLRELPGGGNFIGDFGSLGPVFLQSDSNVVPEPSTWLLLSLGLAGLAAWQRKRESDLQ